MDKSDMWPSIRGMWPSY